MIPAFDYNGVLPTYVNEDPTQPENLAPYEADIRAFVDRFGTTTARRRILRGLLQYREWLRATMGLTDAFQWLDGSFVEDCETIRGVDPNDVDVVTLFQRPPQLLDDEALQSFAETHSNHLDPRFLKRTYRCDGYVFDVGAHPWWTVQQTKYWLSLFFVRRGSRLSKGFVSVPIISNDREAAELLDQLDNHGHQA